jgi:hypothetical protein
MASITTPLSGYKRLKFLDLSHNEIGSEGFTALGLVLKNNLSLQTLLVSGKLRISYRRIDEIDRRSARRLLLADFCRGLARCAVFDTT